MKYICKMLVVFVVYLAICKNGYVSEANSFEDDKADLDANSYALDYGEIMSTGDTYGVTNHDYGVTNDKADSFEDENGVNGAGI